MRHLFFLFIILLSGILQLTLLDYFRAWGIKPDLFLISALSASLIFSLPGALILSAFNGFLKDAAGAGAFGVNTLLFFCLSFLIARLKKNIIIEKDYMYFLLALAAAAMHNTASGLISIYSGNAVPLGIFLRIVGTGSVYTALVFPLLFKIVKKWSPA